MEVDGMSNAEAIRSLEDAIKVNFMDLCNQIHESLGGIEYALCMPKCADWANRTCGECGYILTAMSEPRTSHKKCDIAPREPACPAFVERPKEEHTDD